MAQAVSTRRVDQVCTDCAKLCLEMVRYGVQWGGSYAEPDHMVLLLDCAEVCEMTARLVSFNSQFVRPALTLCAEVAERCAQDCSRFNDDARTRSCVEVCRESAKACQEMLARI